MSVLAKLAGFAVVAVIVFASAWGIGVAVGPVDEPAPTQTPTTQSSTHEHVHQRIAATAPGGTISVTIASTGHDGGS